MAKSKSSVPAPMGAPSGGIIPPPPKGLSASFAPQPAPYMIAPPAAASVMLPQMFGAQPGLALRSPQVDMGYSSALLPDKPPQTAAQVGLQPGDLDAFNSSLAAARTNADTAHSMVGKNDFNFAIPQRSDFDNQLSQALQAKIIENLSGGDSRMDRFNKGFTMGQKIAAAVVVPALGAFSGNGYAQGFNQSTQQTQAAVAQAEALQAAEKQQRNGSLAQLASLYENISPQSSKNITAAVTQQLNMIKMQREAQRQAMADAIAADNKVADLEREKLQMILQGRAAQGNAQDKDFGNTLALSAAQNGVTRDNQTAANQALSQGLQVAGLGLQQKAQSFNEAQAGIKNEQWQKTFDQTAAKNTAEQQGQNISRLRQFETLVNKVDPATGRLLYPGLQNSPAIKAIMNKLQQGTGVTQAEIDAAQSAMPVPQAPTSQGLDISSLAREFGAGLSGIFGGPKQAAQASAMPQAQAKPTDFAAIIKAPTQYIQLSQPQIDQIRANQYQSVLGPLSQTLAQKLGKQPTDQQLMDAYNALEKAYANKSKGR